MWQAPAAQIERALREAAGVIGDSGGEASRSILRNVRVALAHKNGNLLEAMRTAQSGPHPVRHALPGQGAGQGESTIASCLCAIGRTRDALEMLARGQRAAHASGDMFVVVRCQGFRALALLELGPSACGLPGYPECRTPGTPGSKPPPAGPLNADPAARNQRG
jgi:hypothetical protein